MPSLGSGSSLAACHFAHYFALCEIYADSGLEPGELMGKAGRQHCGSPLIPTGQTEGLHWA